MSEELKAVVETINSSTKVEDKEKTFTQTDMNNIVAKNVKEALEKANKELGIESVAGGKKDLAEYKKYVDSQKSELEQAQDSVKTKDEIIANQSLTISNYKLKGRLNGAMSELDIDLGYTDTIDKLIDKEKVTEDMTDKEFKALIESTVDKYLPNLKEDKKVGASKAADKKPIGSAKSYLDAKYKNNPAYKG